MGQYAKDTQVSVDRSKAEIERILEKYGAQGFVSGWSGGRAVIGFAMHGRQVRFVLPLPDKTSDKIRMARPSASGGGWTEASPEVQRSRYEQELRQRWRALALAIKAKLEVVETGITSFEKEFLAHISLPNGESVGDWIAPQLQNAYEKGHMPPLLGYEG